MGGLVTIRSYFLALQLVAANDQQFFVEALFDTGFTDGWLAINAQDLDTLGWGLIALQVEMATAQGSARFDIYSGFIIIDGVEVMVPVHVGDNLPETIMGSFWLGIMRLVADNPNEILTLEMLKYPGNA